MNTLQFRQGLKNGSMELKIIIFSEGLVQVTLQFRQGLKNGSMELTLIIFSEVKTLHSSRDLGMELKLSIFSEGLGQVNTM